MRDKLDTPFPLNQGNIVFSDSGRSAILNSIKILGISPGDKVLLPSYTCFDVIIPFLKSGINIEFYALNEDLSLNRKDLECRIEDGAKALLFIHYFGFSQDLGYIKSLKDTYRIYLIEDCAHAFLSGVNEMPLGNLGDVSIFTLRKMIPVHNVGILAVNNDRIDDLYIWNSRSPSVFKGTLNRIIENVKFRSGITFPANNLKTINKTIKLTILDNPPNKIFPPNGISRTNKKLLHNFDYKNIKNIRRANFKILLDWIKNRKTIFPLFNNLPDGICPLAFPVILKNRDKVCRLMNIDGIDVYPWPFLPIEVGNNYKVAHYLADNILLLPLHQDLKSKHLNYILTSLERALDVTSKEN